ncbi:hypothetical protein HUJ05_001588 [Dendroctonus ponderosae]|nr:hypothetical protein HUJ05_001588 [Dendroctonus ponderosae]
MAGACKWALTSGPVLDAVIYILPGRKNPRLKLNDYEYVVHKQDQMRTRWRCTKRRFKCPAALYSSGKCVEVRRTHNHPSEPRSDHDLNVTSKWDIIYISRGRKYPLMVVDGFEFYMHIQTALKTRWRCVNQRKKCRAVLYTSGKVVKLRRSHNHVPKSKSELGFLIPQPAIWESRSLIQPPPRRVMRANRIPVLEWVTIYVENPKPGKHPKLIVDENMFLRHRTQATKTGVTIRWRCSNVFKTKCKAVLYTTLQEGSVIKALYDHNHESNVDRWSKQRMIAKGFFITRPTQACKRGPPRDLRRARKSKPVPKPPKDTNPQGKEMQVHIAGQAEPIVIKVMGKNVIYFTLGRKYPKIVMDRFEYKRKSNNSSHMKTTWVCTQTGCKARMLSYGKNLCVKAIAHNHPATYLGDYSGLKSQVFDVETTGDRLKPT